MKILIVQLSDIHIVESDDPVLFRTDAIINAVKNIDYDVEAVILLITGDIAFAGLDDQYMIAKTFLQSIYMGLKNQIDLYRADKSVSINFVIIPGNHDCCLTGSEKARQLITKGG